MSYYFLLYKKHRMLNIHYLYLLYYTYQFRLQVKIMNSLSFIVLCTVKYYANRINIYSTKVDFLYLYRHFYFYYDEWKKKSKFEFSFTYLFLFEIIEFIMHLETNNIILISIKHQQVLSLLKNSITIDNSESQSKSILTNVLQPLFRKLFFITIFYSDNTLY